MQKATFYHLYCLNPHCRVSIYQHTKTVCLEVNSANYVAAHNCSQCKRRLASLMNMNIGQIAATASVQLSVLFMPACLN